MKLPSFTLMMFGFALLTTKPLYILASETVTLKSELTAVEYFTKNSQNRNAKISPDGKNLLTIIKKDGKNVFGIMNILEKKMTTTIGIRGTAGNIDQANWVSNSRIVYSTYKVNNSVQKNSRLRKLYAVNKDGSKHKVIFGYGAGEKTTGTRLPRRKASFASQQILDYLSNDEKHILIAYYPWKLSGKVWSRSTVANTLIKKLHVYSGKLMNVDSLPISQAEAIIDNNFDVRFAIGVNGHNESVLSYKDSKSSPWIEFLLDNFEGTHIQPLGFSEDNESVYFSAHVSNGNQALYLFNLKTQSIEQLFDDKNIDMSRIAFDFNQRHLIYVATEKSLPLYHYLEPKNKKSMLHKNLTEAFAGQDVVITSATKDESEAIVFVNVNNKLGDYYLLNTKTLKAEYLMSVTLG
jgi:hypothetical protein